MAHKNSILVLMLATVILFGAVVAAAQPSPIRSNGNIAFTSDRDGNREIYVMDAEGNEQVRLTKNNIVDDHPTWSPNGSKIAFLSQRPSGAFAIFLMNADGSGKTEITPITVPNYRRKIISWSPDGRHLVISHTNGLDIVDADGNNRRFLTFGFDPAWSPDGSKILFANPRINNTLGSLSTIKPDGTDLRVFLATLPWGSVSGYPEWSPDGSRIAFIGGDTANQDMFMSSNGDAGEFFVVGQCRSLSPQGCGSINSLAWSPDGSKIVYGAYGSLYTVDGYGAYQVAVTSREGNSNPSWQPLLAEVSISGKVTTPDGRGLRNAVVTITDSLGVARAATTGSFGMYAFDNVRPAESYVIGVASTRYRFAVRSIQVSENLFGVDFAGIE